MTVNDADKNRDIHTYFGLTYSQFLSIPRSVLQSMPLEWQHKFVELLDELDETNWLDMLPKNSCYHVELRDTFYDIEGRFCWGDVIINDPLADYERGRRKVFD